MMRKMNLKNTDLEVPVIGLGTMRIGSKSTEEVNTLIMNAMELGIDFFDHADIYGGGACEEVFGKAMKQTPGLRKKIILQSKCGIRPGFFDFSKEYILQSVDGILNRLQTEYLDILLLHRPDALMEPEEVAEAFAVLKKAGKVKYFGVSNQNPMQMALLQKYTEEKLVIDQLQFSPTNTTMLQAGLNVNMENASAVNRDGSVLDYCRLHDITVQAWSPLQYGMFEGPYLGSEKYKELNQVIDKLATKYEVTNTAIAIAWILRHPAHIQPILGSTGIAHIREMSKAAEITLGREEWYEIYRSAGNVLP